MKSVVTKKKKNSNLLITDEHFFPRSEYYTRFEGTTAFAMDDPQYWGTYHRSEASRFFCIVGGRQKAQFLSPCVKKSPKTHSFSAHTGGYYSPLSVDEYREVFKLEKLVSNGLRNIHDELLLYKKHMAEIVVESFNAFSNNKQKVTKTQLKRPIIYVENDYPCVLVAFPAINPKETATAAAKYWHDHPKPFQQLLLCSFIAFLNVEAMNENIPIEMVLRASFGHNLPSVCETNNTFRINVGVIPACYAKLIGKVLHLLNEAVNNITDETSLKANFSKKFLSQVETYNINKLKKAITKNKRYESLEKHDAFKGKCSAAILRDLYQKFCQINEKGNRKGKSTLMLVELKDKTIWEVIREKGDSMGKSVLCECFRQKGTEDWFVNQIMEALLAEDNSPIETALQKLLNLLSYGETATMNYKKIHADLSKNKRKFSSLSFKSFYESDSDFSNITDLLFAGFGATKPDEALYKALDRAGIEFFKTAQGSKVIQEEFDYGSDSEFEDDLVNEKAEKTSHVAHKKLRVCSGMKAIVLAQYAALSYFESQAVRSYSKDNQQMYYEVEDALVLVDVKQLLLNKIRAMEDEKILYFDLNHCNATNSENNQTLEKKLTDFPPRLVVLDYTSSTTQAIKNALQLCFSKQGIELVFFVDSGLKNNQGGLDINPYGEIRVFARNRETLDIVIKMIESGLSPEDKLSPTVHEKVRACKNIALAVSFLGLFKTKDKRFQPVQQRYAAILGTVA